MTSDWRLDLWVLLLVGAVLGTVVDCCKGGCMVPRLDADMC